MQYPVPIEGFEGRQVVIETPGIFSRTKLMIDGQPAPKGAKRGQFLLRRNDGTEVTAKLKGIFLDPVPQVVINDGQTVRVVEPLTWYQWVWAGLPILLVFVGGALGGLLGFSATSLSARLYRSEISGLAQYVIVAAISIVAVMTYFIIAVFITSLLR